MLMKWPGLLRCQVNKDESFPAIRADRVKLNVIGIEITIIRQVWRAKQLPVQVITPGVIGADNTVFTDAAPEY